MTNDKFTPPMCACRDVTYKPEPVGDRVRECWRCNLCGAEFMRGEAMSDETPISDEMLAQVREMVRDDEDAWDCVPSSDLYGLLARLGRAERERDEWHLRVKGMISTVRRSTEKP